MLPYLSRAALPIQRFKPSSGAYVPCCAMLQLPEVFASSYQRTPAWSCPSTSTVWLTTIASLSPKFLQARRYIRRSESVSRRCEVPGCWMHGFEPQRSDSKAAVAGLDSWVMVSDGDGPQSTVAFQIWSWSGE